jgi:hypothetical protein
VRAVIGAVRPYDIHGTRYYQIAYATPDAPDRVTEGRVAVESIYPDPQAGDRVEIRLLLGIIDGVTLIERPCAGT